MTRNFVGYGETPPDPRWPGSAKIAISFSLNIEGGGESTLANGDAASEGMLNDIGGQAIVFFVLVVAAAEVVVGLGIVVTNFRRRQTTVADDLDSLKG